MRRVYHFVPLGYGLDDLRQRHLKIAQLDELNDPFELWTVAQTDHRLRQAMRDTKRQLSQECGLLCFSLNWHNPLLWSHYADKHRGVALGFDADEQILKTVSYLENRPVLEKFGTELAEWLLFTKFVDWRYEHEARIYASLKDKDTETGLYFADFGDQLVLREVIAGPLCIVTEQELRDATGSTPDVNLTKARLAFQTFQIVTDERGFLNEEL